MTNITHIQFHIGDFLSGVMHMDGAEIGAYTMMIMAHYQAGEAGLPDDDKKLMRITRTNPKVWKRIKDTVLEKFTLEDGFWKHHRIIDELAKVRSKAGPGRPKVPKESQDGIPKSDFEKPVSDSQVKNKSLKNKETEKTNHNPITNNHEDTNVSSLPIVPHGLQKSDAKSKSDRPPDRFAEFWRLFPPQRKGNKQKARSSWDKAIKENRATQEEMINGVRRYCNSDEVKRGYAKGAAAWINDDRWACDYDALPTPHSQQRPGQRGQNTIRSSGFVDTHAAAWSQVSSEHCEQKSWGGDGYEHGSSQNHL